MKIAIVTPGILPVPAEKGGAVEKLVTLLIESNEEYKDYKIDVYTIGIENLDKYNYKFTNIINININVIEKIYQCVINRIFRYLKISNKYNMYNKKVVKNINQNYYDYVIVENNISIFREIYINTENKKNIIYHIHNDDIDVRNKDIVFIIEKAAKIISVSKFIDSTISKVIKRDNTDVLMNCIDLEKFDRRKIDINIKEEIMNKYKISKDDFVFIYSGRIVKEKGVKELITAFKRIKNSSRNIKLIIVGTSFFGSNIKDEYFNEVIKLASDIKDKIIFTGYINAESMPYLYSLADVLVMPTLCEEAFGITLIEAMSMEIPSIISDSGGMCELTNDECSIIIKRGNLLIDNLKSAMEFLINNDEVRINMGKKSRQIIEENEEIKQENYFENFSNIIKNGRGDKE